MADNKPIYETCDDCGHIFDPSDSRAFLKPEEKKYAHLENSCPACQQMQSGATAWAIWNDCQGIFTCSIFHSKKEAEKILGKDFTRDQEKVVPVRVLVEPEDNWWMRDMHEKEAEKYR